MDPREELAALRRMAELEAKAGGGQTREQRIAENQAADRELYSPTSGNSFGENALAGIGRGISSVGRGLGQAVGLVSPQDIEDAKRIDAPLMATGGGKVGNIVGGAATAAPLALIPGVNSLLGASAAGAGFGVATTEGGVQDRLEGGAFGALGGAAGVGLGKVAGALLDKARGKAVLSEAANAGRAGAAQKAQSAGYVLPPTEVNPNMLNSALEGLSGKIKTSQAASQRNQRITNDLIKQELGLAQDQPISKEALTAYMQRQGSAYEAVKGAGELGADDAYRAALERIRSQYAGAARDFPGLARPEVDSLVTALQRDKFGADAAVDAIKVLRENADKAFRSGDSGFGKANKEAARAIEDLMERNLAAKGADDLLGSYRGARQNIAKAKTVEKALNEGTGDVSAQAIAAALKKGKPLTGNLRTVAETAQSFPKATQALPQNYNALSPLDYAAGMLGATQNPLAMAAVAARPGVRSALLSQAYQSRLAPPTYEANRLLELLRNNRALVPLGVSLPTD
jgi:hypothetical protein